MTGKIFDRFIVGLSFLTLLEVPLSLCRAEYLFYYYEIDIAMSLFFFIQFARTREASGVNTYARFIGALPFELFAHFIGLNSIIVVMRILKVFRVFEVFHLFKWSNFRTKSQQTASLVGGLIVLLHWVTCGWLLVHDFGRKEFLDSYAMAMYWAVTTLSTVGYGDVVPQTHFARFYAMGTMLTGVGIFGIVIGKFSTLIMKADKYQEEKKAKLHGLMDFLERYDVPASLSKQVIRYYQYQFDKKIAEKDGLVLSDLPESFQSELKLFMKIKFIQKLSLFNGLSTDCLKLIASKLEERFYQPRKSIVKNGDLGQEMYIISHGEVEVSREAKVLANLKTGQVFGEMALIEHTVRNADVISKSYSDILILKREDFELITEIHQELKDRFIKIYDDRRTSLKSAS